MDHDTLDMLRTSLRHVLTEASDRPLADRLEELGWDEVVADDAPTALGALFELRGDTLSAADALGPQLSTTFAAAVADPSLASAAVVLPFGVESSLAGGTLAVNGVVTSAPSAATAFIVAVGEGDALRVGVVAAGALSAAPLATTDESLPLALAHGTVAEADVRWLPAGPAAWAAMTARGRWLLAAELVGIGRHVVASAVEYTGDRVQYGKPIGTFQALQHRIASAYSLVVGAGRVVDEAAATDDAWTALVAKALAGQAAETACTQAQQCYGAIGFTWEHEFHRYLRRTYVLDSLLGGWRALEHEIGLTLQRTGHVPQIGSL